MSGTVPGEPRRTIDDLYRSRTGPPAPYPTTLDPTGLELGWSVGVDVTQPAASRVYDYLLGGSHNFAADRELARQLTDADPRAPEYARANRAFLHRAVRFLLDAGVRQFLDVGSGLPTVGNVHQVVQKTAPESRVVYVDIDPIAVTHARQMLAGNPYVSAARADLREPEAIRARLQGQRLLDFHRPIGLLMVAVLHFIPDEDDPAAIVTRWRNLLAPGSALALSHACPPPAPSPQLTAALRRYRLTGTPLTLRSPDEVAPLFTGWRLVPPGLVEVTHWRCDQDDDRVAPPDPVPGVAGVGYAATS